MARGGKTRAIQPNRKVCASRDTKHYEFRGVAPERQDAKGNKMSVKESEAKKKVCPLTLKTGPAYPPKKCVASECMAWRHCTDWAGDSLSLGYCGLAGSDV